MPSSPRLGGLRYILKCSDEGHFCALSVEDNLVAGAAPYTTLINFQMESENE